jgi:hypothetical protein
MRDRLEPYREEMQSVPADDIIGQAALLWKLIYSSVHATRGLQSEFILVRHEDLSRDPVPGYRDLYRSLDLEFTPRVEKIILSSSSSENPVELSRKKTYGVKLDSRASIHMWKKRLSAEEIDRIRTITEDVSLHYYSDAEW